MECVLEVLDFLSEAPQVAKCPSMSD